MAGAKRAGALIVVSLLGSAAVQAEQAGFYVGGSVGRTAHDVDPSVITFVLGAPEGTTELQPFFFDVDDGEIGWSGTFGYRVNAYFAAELSYMDFGDADVRQQYRSPLMSIWPLPPITRDVSVNVRGPALSALASVPAGPVRIFLRGGVLFADAEVELRGLFGGSNPDSFGDEVLLAGVGLDWAFAERWAARLEYQRTGKIERNVAIGENELENVALSVLYRL